MGPVNVRCAKATIVVKHPEDIAIDAARLVQLSLLPPDSQNVRIS